MELLPTYDVLSLTSLEDPYPLFAEWRDAGPLMNGVYGWGVTRHADVVALLRDRRVGRAFPDEMLAVPCGTGPLMQFQRQTIYCMGAMVARPEAGVLFERLVAHTSCIEADGPAQRRPGAVGTYDAVALRASPRKASAPHVVG